MRIVAIGLAVALLLGLAGTASVPLGAQERPLVIALGAEPRSLMAQHIVDWTTNVQQMNIYDRLYYWDGDPPRIKPSLAAEPVQTPDDLTWVIKLRPNVRFHNGDPLTADSVKWTIQHDLYGVNKRVNWKPHPAEKIFLHDAAWTRC